MNPESLPALLFYYGLFLICCGITAVIFIGASARTAVISGGISGIMAIVIGHLISTDTPGAAVAGIVLSFTLFIIFSWRVTKTLFGIFELIRSGSPALKKKGIAFLIIGIMAVVSIFVSLLQVI